MQAPLRTSHKQHPGSRGRRRSDHAVHLCAVVDRVQQRRARAPAARIRRPRQRGGQDGRPVPEQHAPVVGPGRQPPPGAVRQETPGSLQTPGTISTGCPLSTPRIKSTAGEPGRRAPPRLAMHHPRSARARIGAAAPHRACHARSGSRARTRSSPRCRARPARARAAPGGRRPRRPLRVRWQTRPARARSRVRRRAPPAPLAAWQRHVKCRPSAA
jgi:hypothetical protein